MPSFENCPREEFCSYFYGLFLQGAEWDYENKLLIEPITPHLYQEFPVIRCVTEKKVDPTNDGYIDNVTM